MIRFEISDLVADPRPPTDRIELVANVEANFSIMVDDRLVYQEVSFPVVELAVALHQWLAHRGPDNPDFEFESMSAEEPGLVWIRWAGSGWRVGSIDQEQPELTVFDQDEIHASVEALTKHLAQRIQEKFGASWAEALSKLLRE